MMTQSLRGLAGAGAMHWRGDRSGGPGAPFDENAAFLSFRTGFQSLLGRSLEFPLAEMEKLRDFVFSLRYPPNPMAPLDGTLTPSQEAGRKLFVSNGSRSGPGGDGSSCTECHGLPLGTGGYAASRGAQSFKVPHLRNLYQKIGMFGDALPDIVNAAPFTLEAAPTLFLGDQVRGFGFTHDGSAPTLVDFLLDPRQRFSFPDEEGHTGVQKARELEAFLLAFPTGLAPSVGQQVTLSSERSASAMQRFELLERRAAAGDGDLVVHGILDGEARGWLRTDGPAGAARYASDRELDLFTSKSLLEAVAQGRARLTAMLVPPDSGRRIGIDRDEDGSLDRDEADLGFDAADASSHPGAGVSRVLRGDCNDDGSLDLSDAVFGLRYLFLGGVAPSCAESCEANEDDEFDVSDPLIVLRFLFQGAPAPGKFPECEASKAACGSQVCSGGVAPRG